MVLDQSTVDGQIMRAHADGDKEALTKLYYRSAKTCGAHNIDQYCFLLTNAYVCALETGLDISGEIHSLLVQFGREI